MKETLRSAAWLLRLSWRQNRAKTIVALVLVLAAPSRRRCWPCPSSG
jgi:hypothetical protein